MPIILDKLDCNIFGDFKVGDNTGYNADLQCNLIEANVGGCFNKPIVLQAASIIEAVTAQIFYRARNHNLEGVPNISEADRRRIATKQIDKFATIIDNLKKYNILDGMDTNIYRDLHNLRKYRNKIHIQSDVRIPDLPRDENDIFTESLVESAVDLSWRVINYLEINYARPLDIRGYVQPLRLPRVD